MLAQASGVAVVATTSRGSVPAVASACLTYPSDHVLEKTNALSRARIEMSGDPDELTVTESISTGSTDFKTVSVFVRTK